MQKGKAAMLSENQISILNEISILSKLPMDLADSNGRLIRAFPTSIKEFFRDTYRELLIGVLKGSAAPDGIVILCHKNAFYTVVTALDEGCCLITYPTVANVPADADHYQTRSLSSVRRWVYPELQPEFYQLTLGLPVVSTAYLERIVNLAKRICQGEAAGRISLLYTENFESFTPYAPVTLSLQENTGDNDIVPGNLPEHDSPYEENRILDAITEGNEKRLSQVMSEYVKAQIGKMSLNPLRQEKYIFVCFAYAATRAAVKGGLSHEVGFRLSDSYCQKMDTLSSPDQLHSLRREFAHELCRRVAALKGRSGTTLQCCAYIHSHIYEDLSVDELAAAVHLNRHSLSDYFKRDMGISIQDYIIRTRLEEARHLLLDSDMSLSAISALLCYSTQSYFCKKFREKYGMTPQKYRNEFNK